MNKYVGMSLNIKAREERCWSGRQQEKKAWMNFSKFKLMNENERRRVARRKETVGRRLSGRMLFYVGLHRLPLALPHRQRMKFHRGICDWLWNFFFYFLFLLFLWIYGIFSISIGSLGWSTWRYFKWYKLMLGGLYVSPSYERRYSV